MLMHDGVYPLSEGTILQYIYVGNGEGLALQIGSADDIDGWQRVDLVMFHDVLIKPCLHFLTQTPSIFEII